MQYFNTFEDVILFVCSEFKMGNARYYQKMIDGDGRLSKEYKSILRLKTYLDQLKVGPSEFVIKNILLYSKALSVVKSRTVGNISLFMN